MIGPGWGGIAWASLPLAGAVAVLAGRGYGQARPMLVAVARLVVQLELLGVVLGAIVASGRESVVLLAAAAMLLVAAQTVGARQARSRWLIWAESLVAIVAAVALPMALSVSLALGLHPWYTPATFLPLFGMVIGNSVGGLSLAAERFAADLKADRDLVEQRLALGATSRQAALPATRAAVRAGLTPLINSMTIAGIVSIPGMTAGQILAGADVSAAIRYQILIYLAIAATATISTLILLRFRLGRSFTAAHQLRDLDG